MPRVRALLPRAEVVSEPPNDQTLERKVLNRATYLVFGYLPT